MTDNIGTSLTSEDLEIPLARHPIVPGSVLLTWWDDVYRDDGKGKLVMDTRAGCAQPSALKVNYEHGYIRSNRASVDYRYDNESAHRERPGEHTPPKSEYTGLGEFDYIASLLVPELAHLGLTWAESILTRLKSRFFSHCNGGSFLGPETMPPGVWYENLQEAREKAKEALKEQRHHTDAAMRVDKIRELIAGAQREIEHLPRSRDVSCVATKLDEARMWLGEIWTHDG